MSLQVWLPLNGNINNQGLSNNITGYGTISYADGGKVVPKCMSFNGNDNAIKIPFNDCISTEFTFATWFYVDSWGSKTWNTLLGGPGGFELEGKMSGNNVPYIHPYSWGGGSTTTPNSYSVQYEMNKWNHLVFTCNANESKIYLNGELKKTCNGMSSFPTGDYFVGSWRSSTEQNFKGYMNDVRLYDNVISEKEVKELSKGLCLHYKLSRGGENLLKNSSNYLNYTRTSASKDGYLSIPVYANGLTIGKTYTLSCESDGNLSTHGSSSGVDPSNKYWTIWLYQHGTAFSDNDYSRYQTPTCFANNNYNHVQVGNKHYWTFTPSYANVSVRLNTYSDGTNNTSVTFSNIKLEEGSVCTPWLPNKADTLYSALGFNSIEPDCSGYGNDGTISGTLTYSNDTPRYLGSYAFSGSQFIKVPLGAAHPTEAITVSAWVYKKDSNDQRFVSCTEGGGWNFEGTTIQVPIYINGGYRICVGTVTWSSLINGWHHLAFTYDGNTIRLYIDGVENKYYTYSSTKYPITYVNNCTIIGAEASGTGSGATGSGSYFNGNISDVRIYATALSGDDIKALFNNPTSIDNTSKLHCCELLEA